MESARSDAALTIPEAVEGHYYGRLTRLELPKRSRFEKVVDLVAWLMGSSISLGFVIALSLGWLFSGFPLHFNNLWQIIMNDAGSVICWFWDIFLLITQRSSTGKFEAQLTAWLVSGEDKLRWLRSALEDGSLLERSGLPMRSRSEASKLPVDTMYDRAADRVAGFAGLPFTQAMNVVGVAIWIGFGPSRQWNNTWQLDINTAYAQQILLLTPFLHNQHHRHHGHVMESLTAVESRDMAIMRQLQGVAGDKLASPDLNAKAPGQAAPSVSIFDRIVVPIVGFVGSRWGLVTALIVIAVWVGIGDPLGWSNGWWLMLNTITGCCGFIFSYLVRYAIRRDVDRLQAKFALLDNQDLQLLALLGLTDYRPPAFVDDRSYSVRMSRRLGQCLSQPWATVGSIIFVLILVIIGASLKFNFLGQLICNTPTMILEGWNLHFLLPAHQDSHTAMMAAVEELLYRRNLIQDALNARLAIGIQLDSDVPNPKELNLLGPLPSFTTSHNPEA